MANEYCKQCHKSVRRKCERIYGADTPPCAKLVGVVPSASANSDYAAALRVRKEWVCNQHGQNVNDPFSNWCEERLHSSTNVA
jgi:hypothetical protein